MKMLLVFLCALLECASAQYVNTRNNGVYKGREFQPNAGENFVRTFGNNTQQYNTNQNQTMQRFSEAGVCYILVTTASLVDEHSQVPVGNGSRPDLSEVRRCCSGYIQNIHNPMICDPVCPNECVNSLCTAPETCTCFPEQVKNMAGFCVPKCPIGCQNGHCADGVCICNDGFKLHSESQFCVPICRENCGGFGNCTSPNTCATCPSGYESTPEGSCMPVCQICMNGDCVAPDNCRCYPGYAKDHRGECVLQCYQGCDSSGECVDPNLCEYSPYVPIPRSPPDQVFVHQGYSFHGGFSTLLSTSPNNGSQNPYSHRSQRPTNPDQPQHLDHNYSSNQQSQYLVQPPNQTPRQPVSENQMGSHPLSETNSQKPTSNPQNQSNSQAGTVPNSTNYSLNQSTFLLQDNSYTSYDGLNNTIPDQATNNSQSNKTSLVQHQSARGRKYPYQSTSRHTPPANRTYSYDLSPSNQHHYPSTPTHSTYNLNYKAYLPKSSNIQTYPNQPQYPSNQTPVPECAQPCIHGICVLGNICTCKPGYVVDDTDPTESRCKPMCIGGCHNGVCFGPNFCICNIGFYKETGVKGRVRCIKRTKRSVDISIGSKKPQSIAELLIHKILSDN